MFSTAWSLSDCRNTSIYQAPCSLSASITRNKLIKWADNDGNASAITCALIRFDLIQFAQNNSPNGVCRTRSMHVWQSHRQLVSPTNRTHSTLSFFNLPWFRRILRRERFAISRDSSMVVYGWKHYANIANELRLHAQFAVISPRHFARFRSLLTLF